MLRESEKMVPEIRFKGFSQPWKQKTLDELVQFLDEQRKPLKSADRKAGPYPYYGASGIIDHVEAYLFDERLLLFSEDGANIIDRNYPICFVAEGKYWVNNHAHVLRPNAGVTDIFVRDSLERINYEQFNTGTAQPKLNQEVCRNIELNVACPDEQTHLGAYFKSLDRMIGLHQRKHDKLVKLKQAMLQKMFPQDGATTPEIRFKGFEGEWEETIVGEICSISTGKSNTQDRIEDGLYPFYVRSQTVERSNRYLYDEEAVLTVGDGVGTGKVFHYVNGKYDLHQRVYRMFNFLGDTNARFFFYFFSKEFYDRVMAMTAKTSVDSVRMEMIYEMPFLRPSPAEQTRIGAHFQTLDELISKHATQHKKLKNIKSACLEKMFV